MCRSMNLAAPQQTLSTSANQDRNAVLALKAFISYSSHCWDNISDKKQFKNCFFYFVLFSLLWLLREL